MASWLLFRTRITRVFLAGLTLSLIGVTILQGGLGAVGGGKLAGDAMAVVASVFYAGYLISLGRLRSKFSTLTTMLWTTVSAGLCMLPAALIFETGFFPVTLFGFAMLLGLAWITHASGQGLIIYALAWLPPAFSSLTLLVQPVVAAILAWATPGRAAGRGPGAWRCRRARRDICRPARLGELIRETEPFAAVEAKGSVR